MHQIVTNDQKRDLSDAQRARGIQQMIDAGLSVTRVAKKLSVAKHIVKAAETAAKSSVALEALESRQISLTEAAVLTEFEQDGDGFEELAECRSAGFGAMRRHPELVTPARFVRRLLTLFVLDRAADQRGTSTLNGGGTLAIQ